MRKYRDHGAEQARDGAITNYPLGSIDRSENENDNVGI